MVSTCFEHAIALLLAFRILASFSVGFQQFCLQEGSGIWPDPWDNHWLSESVIGARWEWHASKCCTTRCVPVRPILQCHRSCKDSKGPFLSKSSDVVVLLGRLIFPCPLFLFGFFLLMGFKSALSSCCKRCIANVGVFASKIQCLGGAVYGIVMAKP